ncbi:MAG: iron-sulfur cluster repair di-iron protein [Flammeovirgaceae bacterium]
MKILDIVDQNYIYATVLRFFGIDFYKHPEQTLEQLCRKKSIDLNKLLKHLQLALKQPSLLQSNYLSDYSVDVIIEFLKDSHRQFIWHQLPYVADLIANIDLIHFDHPELARDLKFVFPLFAEDFIRHVYEEEETSFAYILRLHEALEGNEFNPGALFFDLKHNSIQQFAEEHLEDDDEMHGIRELTNNYQITDQTSTYTKVIYSELKKFEVNLQLHANIEDNILMKKGYELEVQAWEVLDELAAYN